MAHGTVKILAVLTVITLAAGVMTGEVAQAGKRGKHGKRGAVVVPAWVKSMTTRDTPVHGARRPDLVVVEFSDYECPFCTRAHDNMLRVLKKYGKRIRFYYRHYPLDAACNTTLRSPMHRHACLAARAAICAHAQGRFWSFHDKLYRLKATLSRAAILGLATTVKLGRHKFRRCLISARTRRILQADLAAGNRAKLTGTPTFYAGGPDIKRFEFSSPRMKTFDSLFTLLDSQRNKPRPR